MTVLAAEGLSRSFGGVEAVADVSFALGAGEMLALIGPNGAGKSTLFNLVGGQLRPDRGAVRLRGRPITGLSPRAIWRQGVGRTFQVAATFGSMTVRENAQVALISATRQAAEAEQYPRAPVQARPSSWAPASWPLAARARTFTCATGARRLDRRPAQATARRARSSIPWPA